MTSLVYALQPDQVFIAMDTLVVNGIDKTPAAFQRKFLPIPEFNLLIAGTGSADFINGWFQFVPKYLMGCDIDDLNIHAPEILNNSAKELAHESTIYHFGYSVIENSYVGYAYRSTASFKSEKLKYVLGFKPVIPTEGLLDVTIPKSLVDIVCEQQRYDKLKPVENQVGIGGEIEIVELKDKKLTIKTAHRFLSYDDEKNVIEQIVNA
jgi:hypothetical protein